MSRECIDNGQCCMRAKCYGFNIALPNQVNFIVPQLHCRTQPIDFQECKYVNRNADWKNILADVIYLTKGIMMYLTRGCSLSLSISASGKLTKIISLFYIWDTCALLASSACILLEASVGCYAVYKYMHIQCHPTMQTVNVGHTNHAVVVKRQLP